MRMIWAAAALAAAIVGAAAAEESAETARYRVEIQLDWTPARHPLDYPQNAHFSRVIGTTHTSRYALFRDGDTASSGFALVATNGRTSVLEAELAEAMRRRRVGAVFFAPALNAGSGTVRAEFEATERHALVSFATMLAPSPDWITGVASVPLRAEGAWVARIEAPLWVWDAGADSGETYAAKNAETQPRQSVRLLATPHALTPDGLQGVGRAVFTRLE
ncbi:MAG: spondin domain-containing protein [Pseudomonadota bacterium]